MKHKTALLSLLIFLASLGAAQAALYEYTDENGVPHVTSDPAKVPEKYKEASRTIAEKEMPPPDEAYLERRKASADKAAILAKAPKVPSVSPEAASAPAGTAKPKVEIYMKSWCPYCKMAKSLLDSRGVSYTSYDLEQDPAAYSRFQALGGTAVPLLVIGSRVIQGYSQDQILSALGS